MGTTYRSARRRSKKYQNIKLEKLTLEETYDNLDGSRKEDKTLVTTRNIETIDVDLVGKVPFFFHVEDLCKSMSIVKYRID